MPHRPSSAPPGRDAFDLDPGLIYLNSGTHSICPRVVTDAVVERLRTYERNPTGNLIEAWAALWETQKRLGAFLRARPEDLAFRPNVTSAMNDFILNIPLTAPRGGGGPGEILHSDAEYPAIINIARYRAERDDLHLRAFHLPGTPEELAELDEAGLTQIVVDALRPETRMLVLSHVTTGHGLRLPIERIAAETRQRGVLLVIDGAHATGALDVDFARLEDADFYGGNLHKWFMGPKGTGFAWVHPRHHDRLEPREIGWTTYEAASSYSRFAPGHRFAQRHLHAASLDFAPFQALNAAFDFWQDPAAIRRRLAELQNCVETEMRKQTDWALLSAPGADLRGPLLAYRLPEKLESEEYDLMKRILADHHLQVASSRLQGKWILRISPHLYNTEDEIRRAACILAQL